VLVVPRDVVADDGLAYAERLRTAGVPVTTDLVDGVFHGFLVFSPTLDAATAAQDRIGAAIRDHLGVGL
jgi:acetyl esterase